MRQPQKIRPAWLRQFLAKFGCGVFGPVIPSGLFLFLEALRQKKRFNVFIRIQHPPIADAVFGHFTVSAFPCPTHEGGNGPNNAIACFLFLRIHVQKMERSVVRNSFCFCHNSLFHVSGNRPGPLAVHGGIEPPIPIWTMFGAFTFPNVPPPACNQMYFMKVWPFRESNPDPLRERILSAPRMPISSKGHFCPVHVSQRPRCNSFQTILYMATKLKRWLKRPDSNGDCRNQNPKC